VSRNATILALCLAPLWGFALGCTATTTPRTETAVCSRVIDGDTIELDDGRIVRLTDRDAFEIRRGKRLRHQAEAAGISADEALARGRAQAEQLRRQIEGRTVTLEFDESPGPPTDRYGRILARLRQE